jgi:hypothetical protein
MLLFAPIAIHYKRSLLLEFWNKQSSTQEKQKVWVRGESLRTVPIIREFQCGFREKSVKGKRGDERSASSPLAKTKKLQR